VRLHIYTRQTTQCIFPDARTIHRPLLPRQITLQVVNCGCCYSLTKSRPHDRTRPHSPTTTTARSSRAVVLVLQTIDWHWHAVIRTSHTHPGTPCQGRLVVNTRRPCPCLGLLDRGTTAVSRRLVSVVPCSTRNEANSNLLLMFFPLSFIFKLLATLLLFYIPVIPLTNSILYI